MMPQWKGNKCQKVFASCEKLTRRLGFPWHTNEISRIFSNKTLHYTTVGPISKQAWPPE